MRATNRHLEVGALVAALVFAICWTTPTFAVRTVTNPPMTSTLDAGLLYAAWGFGVALSLLLLCSVLLFVLVVTETRAGRPPSIETSWGGFGGSRGGWRLSPALVFLLGSILFGGLFGTLASRIIGSPEFHAWTGVSEKPEAPGEDDAPKQDEATGAALGEAGDAEPEEPTEESDSDAAADDGGEA